MALTTRNASAVIGALFIAWIALLAVRSGVPFHFDTSQEKIERRLSALHETLEKHAHIFGEYPSTGGAWVLVGDGVSEDEGVKTFPSKLAAAPAFTDPAKAPPVSIIYVSDGKDYKLLAHLADKAVCVETYRKNPSLVDPARRISLSGFLRGPSWRVSGEEEPQVVDFLEKEGAYHPRLDKSLNQYLWGTCWAFGFWTPGAALW